MTAMNLADVSMAHYDETAERAVIACVLLDPKCAHEVTDLPSSDFGSLQLRTIWEAILRLEGEGSSIDVLTVREELVAHGALERAGREEVLMGLTEHIPAAGSVVDHARRVRGYALIRAVVSAAQFTLARSMTAAANPREFAEQAELAVVQAVRQRVDSRDPVLMRVAVEQAFERLNDLNGGKAQDTPLATRWPTLNRKLGGGIAPGQLVIVAGRPGMGKTSFGLDIALHFAGLERGTVLFHSLEMEQGELTSRAISLRSGVDGERCRFAAQLTHDDWRRLTLASAELAELALLIDDTPAVTLQHIRSRARLIKARDGLAAIVVDYLQLMRAAERGDTREREVSEISSGLKALAKELRVPVVALAQLNRDIDKRSAKDRRPQLSDLRESGSLEQDADVVLFVFREEFYRRDDPEVRGRAEIIIGKQRSGPTSTVACRWFGESTRFEELARAWDFGGGDLEDMQPHWQERD